jgi:5-methylcytosine-specific restriction enzyme subunit McrC
MTFAALFTHHKGAEPMRRLTLTEYQTTEGVPLSQDECDILRQLAPSVGVTPSLGRAGFYDLTPSSWIGAITLSDLAIQIRPKVPISRVLFLISYALDPKHWRQTGFDFTEEESLVEAIIPGFVFQLHRALDRGILRSYRPEEASLMTVRGRIRMEDQIRDRFGIAPPVEVRYDEFTEDIEENRLLKAGIRRLAKMRTRSEAARRQLRRFDTVLEPVTPIEYHPRRLPTVPYTRLNCHYRPAIELAKLILRSVSFELRHGQVSAAAFLVDMNDVFETFALTALREELGLSERAFPRGRQVGLYLDRGRNIALQPDLSWWEGSRCVFVGDAKYKRLNVPGVTHPDLYQLLAYTVATNLPGGLLVYAAGEGEPAIHEVVHLSKDMEVVSLDLTGNPDAILNEVRRVAGRVRLLRQRAVASSAAA